MYAVVKTGGKQYRVAVGDRLKVEKLVAQEGELIELDQVLMVGDGDHVSVGTPLLPQKVAATVLAQGRAKKIRVFKMKRRKDYRRTQGHRQSFTEIEIITIGDKSTKNNAVSKKSGATKVEAKNGTTQQHAKDNAVDNLTQIKGIGSAIAEKLSALGITTVWQIAEFDQAMIDKIDDQLNFKGRIEREDWVNQAKKLSDDT